MGKQTAGLAPATIAVKGGNTHRTGAGVSPSIQLSSTFVHSGDPSNPDDGIYSYGRGDSPGFAELERAIAELEHGADAVVFNAGISAAIAALAEGAQGTAVVLPYDAYYGIRARASELLPMRDIEVRLVDQTNLDDVREALSGASLFWTETPTNPLLAIADLEAIGEICAGMNIPWFCDNTFATPIAQNPLDYGAVGAMHSVTKYIGGHSDLILGAVAVNDLDLAKRLRGRRGDVGTQPDGFTCWLARRGSQTLAVRFERQCANALELAQRLQAHPAVEHVFYPGLSSHPGRETAKKQMRGYFGAMLSFIVKGGQDAAQRAVDRCEIFVTATSLGGVESLIERRARWTAESAHPGLLRLSVGIEDVDDLWRDLAQALDGGA
ncbi:MAG TPA: aminotransferase class I/II-fold pyridoxal phosphate-dependent enzyme [Thermomicrobiales bacterium]|nr:aminotransferase class I/II-fold pyridoxal phosphate-dependent enzyme [Thermomicrobiales bacterium]